VDRKSGCVFESGFGVTPEAGCYEPGAMETKLFRQKQKQNKFSTEVHKNKKVLQQKDLFNYSQHYKEKPKKIPSPG